MERVLDKFLQYVKIDTQSDPNSNTFPSTMKQKNLSKLLLKELKEMGLEAYLDEYGYVYAKLDSNTDKKGYKIGLISHVDTSPDAPGENVNPRIIKNYDGKLIKLNDTYKMSPNDFPELKEHVGKDLVVTDGNTLLGADDKAGVAEIMTAIELISEDHSFKHDDIYICFTPDEEIGQGTKHFNYDWFKADFAYTVDGGKVGGIEYENFNAASAKVTFTGKSIHPGSAKNKMVNAVKLLIEFDQMLPQNMVPEKTEGYEGFNHIHGIFGEVEKATSTYIIRNHDIKIFESQKRDFYNIKKAINERLGYNAVEVEIEDSYYNMAKFVKDKMHIVEIAQNAIIKAGLEPFSSPIRGGTDGAMLTYNGLVCPNLGTGGYNYHGRFEYAVIQQMEKSVEILLNILRID